MCQIVISRSIAEAEYYNYGDQTLPTKSIAALSFLIPNNESQLDTLARLCIRRMLRKNHRTMRDSSYVLNAD